MASSATRLAVLLSVLFVGAGFLAVAPARAAGVTQKTVYRYYPVRGRTALDMVTHMHSNGLHGVGRFDKAYATLDMDFKVLGTTRQSADRCHIANFGLALSFKVTLPRLVSRTRRDARRQFTGFQRFARRHELHHRKLYLGCVRRGVRRIRKFSSIGNCDAWIDKAGAVLVEEFKLCNRQHEAFDRQEQARLLKTALMRTAIRQSLRVNVASARRGTLEREIRRRWSHDR